jgi:hypothetical protein
LNSDATAMNMSGKQPLQHQNSYQTRRSAPKTSGKISNFATESN